MKPLHPNQILKMKKTIKRLTNENSVLRQALKKAQCTCYVGCNRTDGQHYSDCNKQLANNALAKP